MKKKPLSDKRAAKTLLKNIKKHPNWYSWDEILQIKTWLYNHKQHKKDNDK